MNRRAMEVAERRAELQQQCAEQRVQLLAALDGISGEVQGVERAMNMVRQIRLPSVLLAGAAAVALGLGSARTARLLGRGWVLFASLRRLWRALQTSSTSGESG